MALAHTLGFPRIGADRELKKALEAYWKGDLSAAALQAVGRELRARHWQLQKDAGIDPGCRPRALSYDVGCPRPTDP